MINFKYEKLKRKTNDILAWAKDNPGMAVGAVVAAASVVGEANKLYRNINSARNIRMEREHRERSVYDPAAGIYIKTKRAMTNREKIEYSVRRRNGETPTQILRSMRLI